MPLDHVTLPPQLQAQLNAFKRSLKRSESRAAVAGAVVGILASYGLLFISDRVWATQPAWRALLLALAGAALAMAGAYWGHRWVWKRRTLHDFARMIQKRHRVLGDRLLGIVELTEHTSPGESPALSRAAIRQVAAEAARLDFVAAVPRRNERRARRAMLGLAVVLVVVVVAFRGAAWNTLQRWLNPISAIERYTFVQLEFDATDLVVAHGEPFLAECALANATAWRPQRANATFAGQPPVTATRSENDSFRFEIPGQLDPGLLVIRAGDAVHKIQVTPMYRPVLRELKVTIRYPDYLEYPAVAQTVKDGRIEFLANSWLEIQATASRALRSATLSMPDPEPLRVVGAQFASGRIAPGDLPVIELDWRDEYGLGPAEPRRILLLSRKDEMPYIESPGSPTSIAILEDEKVTYDFSAIDDFGLKDLGATWTVATTSAQTPDRRTETVVLTSGGARKKELTGSFPFLPATARVAAGSIVSLYGHARDYHPHHPPARSTIYTIRVLNLETHAEMIQNAMDAIQNDLEQITRATDNTHQQTKDLRSKEAAEVESDAATTQLAQQKEGEDAHGDALRRLSDKVRETIGKAMKNKLIPERTLLDLADAGSEMQDIADDPMQQASDQLSQAQGSKSGRGKKMDEAIQKQDKAMKRMQELQESFNQSVERMLAQTFVNRLRASASDEKELSGAILQHLEETVGLNPKDLADEQRHMRAQQVSAQQDTTKQVQHIQNDLAGFFNRTRRPVYHRVYSNMLQDAATDGLTDVARMIASNKSFKSIDGAEKWAGRLNEWADILQKASDEAAAQSAQQNENTPIAEQDMEILLALERARQQEESIREQTRAVDESRDDNRQYRSDARRLARRQGDVAKEMLRLERLASNDNLGRLLEKVSGEMMNTEVMLRRPQTDQETISIETEIIELLGACQKACQSSAQAASREAMMKMLGIGTGGGGFNQGEGSPTPGLVVSDGRGGRSGAGRDVEKAGGRVKMNIPVEFKDALEGYLNAVDSTP